MLSVCSVTFCSFFLDVAFRRSGDADKMCGRFTLRTPLSVLIEQFELRQAPQLPLRFNIAPTQAIAAVRICGDSSERQLHLLRWGLVPSWAKDPAGGAKMINARAETVADKPAFRAAFRCRRCLIPADGYYEWKKEGAKKRPFHIRRRDDRPFAFAGLWETWRGGGEEQPLETCTILTTDANEVSRAIHDRMPVIVDKDDYALWLDPSVQERERLQPLLRTYDSAALVASPVSLRVNNVHNDDPACLEPTS